MKNKGSQERNPFGQWERVPELCLGAPAVLRLLKLLEELQALAESVVQSSNFSRGGRAVDSLNRILCRRGAPKSDLIARELRGSCGGFVGECARFWAEIPGLVDALCREVGGTVPSSQSGVAADPRLKKALQRLNVDLSRLVELIEDLGSKLEVVLCSRRLRWGSWMCVGEPASKRIDRRAALDFTRCIRLRADECRRGVCGQPPESDCAASASRLAVWLPETTPRITYAHDGVVKLSVMILNRNGERHLHNLFSSFLEHNTFAELEFIVVDHASHDGSRALLEKYSQILPLQTVAYGRNYTFSYSNNRAAEFSRGDFLLFLNNDIIFCADVLPDLMAEMIAGQHALLGVELRYPKEEGGLVRAGALQHAGIRFREDVQYQFYRPFNLQEESIGPVVAPAVTAAALLCRREEFFRLGGFHEEYNYGYEDVDFCLKHMRGGGKAISVLRQDSLVHDESATQNHVARQELATRRRGNIMVLRRRFLEYVRGQVWEDLLEARGVWMARDLHVGFVSGEGDNEAIAAELGDALHQLHGWQVSRLTKSNGASSGYDVNGLDVLVVMHDACDLRSLTNQASNLVKIAWIRREPERWVRQPWFGAFDLCWCGDEQAAAYVREQARRDSRVLRLMAGAQEFKTLLSEFVRERWRIAIKVPAPSHAIKHEWGDYHFALALKAEFELLGHSVRIDLLPEWDTPLGMGDDVVLVLRGLSRYEPKPGQVNLLWLISHPEEVTPEEYASYDCVLTASLQFAENLRCAPRPVAAYPLLQCTDTHVFFRDEDPEVPAHEVLFVGNSRKRRRRIVMDAIASGLPLSVYGSQWEGLIPAEYIKGQHIPNSELRKYYSRAAVVLNDHWPDMSEQGFISNRIFDAGACGACVVSDTVQGLEEVFPEGVTVYNGGAEDLKCKVTELLKSRALREERGACLKAAVDGKHTFTLRAARLLEVANSVLAKRRGKMELSPQEQEFSARGGY